MAAIDLKVILGTSVKTATVTPSDSAALPFAPRAVRCDSAGNLAVEYADGSTETIPFAAGETQYIQPTLIKTTGTTVSGTITIYL